MDCNWCCKLDPILIDIVQNKFGFKKPTPVQSITIPSILNNKDVCVESCTGSGKSLAFILPALQFLIKKKNNDLDFSFHTSSVLIISPTRELTKQLYLIILKFLEDKRLYSFIKCLILVGGKNPVFDSRNYVKNGGNIIITTPKRFFEVTERCNLLSNQIKKNLDLLIIDEADLLLQLGFENSLNRILSLLPKQRRTGLFSATLTKRIDLLFKLGLLNPIKIEIKEKYNLNLNLSSKIKNGNLTENLNENALQSLESTGLNISPYLQNKFILMPSSKYKLAFLIEFINKNFNKKLIVFFATCAQITFFTQAIKNHLLDKVTIYQLHRKMNFKRQKIFEMFKLNEDGCALFCTDLISRGIHIPKVDWVINFDLPNNLQTFIHRSGRSGHEIGVQGNSLTLCLSHEIKFIQLCKEKNIFFSKYVFDINLISQLKDKINAEIKERTRNEFKFFKIGLKSFVSFIRVYSSKNILSYILFKELDVIDVINSYGLIKIPDMPELKNKIKGNLNRFECLDLDRTIFRSYKKILVENKLKKDSNNLIKKSKESIKIAKKIKKLKGKKKIFFLKKIEFDELAADAKMVKKVKQGKISENDLDKHFKFNF